MAGFDLTNETVPGFIRRIGDQVIQGSNNTLIVLGVDRAKNGPASVDDGVGGKGAGTIHIVAGRVAEDPDFSKDSAFLYVTSKTEVDKNLGLDSIESLVQTGPAIIGKSDHLRFVAKKDLKIIIGSKAYIVSKDEGQTTVIESPSILLGKNAAEKLIRGSVYRQKQQQLNQSLAAALTAAATQLNTAGGDATLSGFASTAATAIVSAGGALQQAAAAIRQFEASANQYLSGVSKTL